MILEDIKSETAVFHAKVEASALMSPITSKKITKDQYIHILNVFYAYFSGIEQQIDQVSDIMNFLPDYTTRRKSEWLLVDLEHLHAEMEPATDIVLPEITTIAQALGALYVMEGSTLGGRFISMTLKESMGIDASSGTLFFNGYGPETGTKWTGFKQALTDYCTDEQKSQDVIAVANETFSKFYDWIVKAGSKID
ncbi:MAG: biliverdin-producing heme oxygenase [Cytophagales bacterium]|nr:biliverdin-producing heme oxygenase [Cytophaga sp.]